MDRSGVIRTARLIDPASVTPLGTIGEDVILGTASLGNLPASNVQGSSKPSMISVFPDLAPGLTTCMGARRNWHQLSDGDFQSTSLTDAPASLRALLK